MPAIAADGSRAQAPTCWRSYLSRRHRAQEADGLCWQRGGLLDLEGMLLIAANVNERKIKVREIRVRDRRVSFSKSVASDKAQEKSVIEWITFEVALYLSWVAS